MSVIRIPSPDDMLIVVAQFPTCSPQRLFEYWTKPELVTQWWSISAEIEPCLGGFYHFFWPQTNWHLRGLYTAFQPGQRLAFTWRWGHHPVQELVLVAFEPFAEHGTHMIIGQGSYNDTLQSQEDKQSHLDGWMHFVPRLQHLMQTETLQLHL